MTKKEFEFPMVISKQSITRTTNIQYGRDLYRIGKERGENYRALIHDLRTVVSNGYLEDAIAVAKSELSRKD